MSRSVPPAVSELAVEAVRLEDRYWYEQELSVDELARTVAVINAALRAGRA